MLACHPEHSEGSIIKFLKLVIQNDSEGSYVFNKLDSSLPLKMANINKYIYLYLLGCLLYKMRSNTKHPSHLSPKMMQGETF
ncbi:MAG: hypothetical protein K0Q97_150 [Bacillota bacterium]|jgi:hypothetical protein|nr:hypothetical protein [Bacillota bacterium]